MNPAPGDNAPARIADGRVAEVAGTGDPGGTPGPGTADAAG
jgi:hypothetical protein